MSFDARTGTLPGMPIAEFDELPSVSKAFVKGLDRSVLGAFAVDSEPLFLCDVKERWKVVKDRLTADGTLPLDDGNYRWSADALAEYGASYEEIYHLFAELYYWWGISDDPELVAAVSGEEGKKFTDGIARLATIAAHPEMHDFFYVGIWDTEFIERCITDGVDVDLALSMSGRSAHSWKRIKLYVRNGG